MVESAGALCACTVLTAGMRHCVVVAAKPGSVGPAGVICHTAALQLSLQVVHSCGLSTLSVVLHEDFVHRALQVFVYLALVDEAKYQSCHFSCKDHHDDDEEKAKADFGLPDCGAASNQTENEHQNTDADDDSCWDQRVLVLDETVKVVIALDHVGTDVGGDICAV